MREWFTALISTEEYAKEIEKVVYHIKNDNIPYNIGLIDTPGTESLIERHIEVVKNVVEGISDAIVVIIPCNEPVSEELLNYINTNLKKYIDNCIFVVTKVELLSDLEEMPRLMRVIKKRLENGVGFPDPVVIPMPSLLYLKSVDPDVKITLLDNIDEKDKSELLTLYKNGYDEIYKILDANRDKFIRNKLILICEQVSDKLIDSLQEKAAEHAQVNEELIRQQVPGLSEFRKSMHKKIENDVDQIKDIVLSNNSCLVHDEYDPFAVDIETRILNQKDFDSIVECVHNLEIDILSDHMRDLIHEKEDEVRAQEMDICKSIERFFYEQYTICGELVGAQFEMMPTDDTALEEFINSQKEEFQMKREGVISHVKAQTKGVVGFFKSLSSKNIQKEKTYVISTLQMYMEEEERKSSDFVRSWSITMIDQLQNRLSDYVDNLINSNAALVAQYAGEKVSLIEENKKKKEHTEDNIKKIESYISILRRES